MLRCVLLLQLYSQLKQNFLSGENTAITRSRAARTDKQPGNLGNALTLSFRQPGNLGNTLTLSFRQPGYLGNKLTLSFRQPRNLGNTLTLSFR